MTGHIHPRCDDRPEPERPRLSARGAGGCRYLGRRQRWNGIKSLPALERGPHARHVRTVGMRAATNMAPRPHSRCYSRLEGQRVPAREEEGRSSSSPRCFVPEGFAPARAVSPVLPVTAYLSTARDLRAATKGTQEATGRRQVPVQRNGSCAGPRPLDSPHIASSLAPGTRDADGLEPSGGVLDHGGPRSSALAFLEGHDEHETVSFCSRAELSNALGPAAPLRGWGRRGSSEQLDGM